MRKLLLLFSGKRAGPSWRKVLTKDVPAGFVNAVVSVPDGLASAALAGVNPVYGLYTGIAAPIGGSLLVSAQLMQVSTTSASALAAAQAIRGYPEAQQDAALFLLVVLTGLFLAVFGLLRLGRLARFVSHSVMIGFLSGVAAVLVMDQLAPLVGFDPQGANEVAQFLDLLAHAAQFSPLSMGAGVLALAIAFGLGRTRFAAMASVAALLVPSVLVALLDPPDVQRVADVSVIPQGLPMPALPDLSLLGSDIVFAAFAIAVVIAIQGVGVSQSIDNPDGSAVDTSRDMVAQGVANTASGLLSGIPAGGSVGQTALNISVGAQSRWSGVFGGLWMLLIVLLAPRLVGLVPMPVLAALMIQAGIAAINREEVGSIWKTGFSARVTMLATLIATLMLSIPEAVAIGVLLTVLFNLSTSASDVRVKAWVEEADGLVRETAPPPCLPSNGVTLLEVYGSLFFAGARTLQQALPRVAGSERPVVVIRLRGRTRVGATLIEVLDDYADALAAANGRLYLSGIDPDLARQLRRAGKLELDQVVHLIPADAALGHSTRAAVASAHAWLDGTEQSATRNDQS